MTNYFSQEQKTKSGNIGYCIKNILPVTIFFMLSGCGESPTSAVKDLYIDNDMTMTTSQLLDNRKICKDVKWNSFEDQHKRTIVEYKCTFVNTADYLAKKREAYLNNQNILLNERIKNFKDQIGTSEGKMSDLKNNGSKIIEDRLKQYDEKPVETSNQLTKLIQVVDQLNKIKNNYSDDSYINFLLTNEFRSLLGAPYTSPDHSQMLRYFSDSIGPFSAQVGWMRRQKTAAEREQYKKENVDRYLQGMRGYMGELNVYFNDQIESENKVIQEAKAAHITRLESMKAQMLQSVDENIEELKKNVINLNESIASAEEELRNLKKKSDKLFPTYEKIVETFQCIVNKENKPTPAYGELVAVSSDENRNKVLIKHINPEKAFITISKIDTDNYEEYVQKVSAINLLDFIYN